MNKRDACVERPASMWLRNSGAKTSGSVGRKGTDVPSERPQSGWMQSSFELLTGLEIAEFSDAMLPESFDKLFRT